MTADRRRRSGGTVERWAPRGRDSRSLGASGRVTTAWAPALLPAGVAGLALSLALPIALALGL